MFDVGSIAQIVASVVPDEAASSSYTFPRFQELKDPPLLLFYF
jgi:hypothetical protein